LAPCEYPPSSISVRRRARALEPFAPWPARSTWISLFPSEPIINRHTRNLPVLPVGTSGITNSNLYRSARAVKKMPKKQGSVYPLQSLIPGVISFVCRKPPESVVGPHCDNVRSYRRRQHRHHAPPSSAGEMRSEELDYEPVAPLDGFLGTFLRPIVKPFAGFHAQFAPPRHLLEAKFESSKFPWNSTTGGAAASPMHITAVRNHTVFFIAPRR
jgi:hypothetical protein